MIWEKHSNVMLLLEAFFCINEHKLNDSQILCGSLQKSIYREPVRIAPTTPMAPFNFFLRLWLSGKRSLAPDVISSEPVDGF